MKDPLTPEQIRGAAKWHLEGRRAPPTDGGVCTLCGSPAQPCLHLARKRTATGIVLCLPCIGQAVENATGWKVLNSWSQWHAAQLTSTQVRADAQDRARTRAAQNSQQETSNGS